MATEKWVTGSGVGLTWSAAFGTNVGAVVNGNSVMSTVSIANGTALDMFADLSVVSATTINPVAPAYLGVYLYPLAHDGAIYGGGQPSTASATVVPPANYYVGSISAATTGSGAPVVAGTITGIVIPPGSFSFVIYNQMGATLATTVAVQYRTYNRAVA
jgi:hypothetical protein